MTKLNEADSESKVIVGESTPIRIGLVIIFLSAFASAIWWASSINSKLDSILSLQATTTSKIASLETELGDLKLKLALDEASIKTLQENIASSIKK